MNACSIKRCILAPRCILMRKIPILLVALLGAFLSDATLAERITITGPGGSIDVTDMDLDDENNLPAVTSSGGTISDPNVLTGSSFYIYNTTFQVGTVGGETSDDYLRVDAAIEYDQYSQALFKTGSGTLELTQDNSSDNVTTIREGTLKLSGDGAFGSGKDVTIASGATLEFAYANTGTGGYSFDYYNYLGSGNIVKSNAGTIILGSIGTEQSPFNGNTIINGGVLELKNSSVVYNLSGGEAPVGDNEVALIFDQNLTLNIKEDATSLYIGKILYTGSEDGCGTITKDGSGVLQIYNEAEGGVCAESFVISSGRMDFKGCMTASVELQNDVQFSPGNSAGTADINGDFIAPSGTTLIFEQDASGYDQLRANNIAIATGVEIVLDFATFEPGVEYDIIVAKNVLSITDPATWKAMIQGGLPEYVELSVYNNTTVRLQNTQEPPAAVPEPSTWALMALGVVILFLRKRVRS